MHARSRSPVSRPRRARHALQLYSLAAIGIFVLQLHATPYRSVSDNFVDGLGLGARVHHVCVAGHPADGADVYLRDLGQEQTKSSDGSLLIVAVLITSAVLVLTTTIVMLANAILAAQNLPVARWVSDGSAAAPRVLHYHCFVSHQWSSGQNRACHQVAAHSTRARSKLDVDNLTDVIVKHSSTRRMSSSSSLWLARCRWY